MGNNVKDVVLIEIDGKYYDLKNEESQFKEKIQEYIEIEYEDLNHKEEVRNENNTQYFNIEDLFTDEENISKKYIAARDSLYCKLYKLNMLKEEIDNLKKIIKKLEKDIKPKEFTTKILIKDSRCESVVIALKNISDNEEDFTMEVVDCLETNTKVQSKKRLKSNEVIKFIISNVPKIYVVKLMVIEGSYDIIIVERMDEKNIPIENSNVILKNMIRTFNDLI